MNHATPSNLSSDHFEQLLQAARAGSSEAVGRILDGYRAYLQHIGSRHLQRRLGTKCAVADLVQDTFAKAIRDLGQFQGSSEPEFRAWLRRILIHHCANFRRRFRGRTRQAAREVSLDRIPHGEHLDEQLWDRSPSPQEAAARTEEAEIFLGALRELPAHYQTALRLHDLQGYTFEQVGASMDCSPDAARKRCTRAVRLLRRTLGTIMQVQPSCDPIQASPLVSTER